MERLHGVWGLGMLARKNQSDNATRFLIRLLDNSDALVRGQAAQALGEAPLPDSSALLPLLKDGSTRVEALAALALCAIVCGAHHCHTAELTHLATNHMRVCRCWRAT